MAGAVGFLVDSGVLYLGTVAGLGHFVGRALSFLCAVWVTWRINRRFTFAAERKQSAWAEWWSYLTAMSAGGIVNYAAYGVAVLYLPPSAASLLVAVAIGSVSGMIVNYTTARLWVFSPR